MLNPPPGSGRYTWFVRERMCNILLVPAMVIAAGCAAAVVPKTQPAKTTVVVPDAGPRVRFEVRLVDDDFEIPERAIPASFETRTEAVRQGPESAVAQHVYVLVKLAPAETRASAMARGDAWAKTLALPPGEMLAWEALDDWDSGTQTSTVIGVRSFVLKADPPILTATDIVDAEPKVDTYGGAAEVSLGLTLSKIAGFRFEQFTEVNVKRRVAIVFDGRVRAAPVIQTKITGGFLTVTMGGGDPARLINEAKKLAKALESH